MKAGRQVCAQQKQFSPFQELASSFSFTPTQGMGKEERKPLSGLEAPVQVLVEHVTQWLPAPCTSKQAAVKDSTPTNEGCFSMFLQNSKLQYLPEKAWTEHKNHLTWKLKRCSATNKYIYSYIFLFFFFNNSSRIIATSFLLGFFCQVCTLLIDICTQGDLQLQLCFVLFLIRFPLG